MTVSVLEEQVLLVVGSVGDEHLGIGRASIERDEGVVKMIRMSRTTFLTKLVTFLEERHLDFLDEVVTHTERKRRPVPIEFNGIENADGMIGAVMMDRKTRTQLGERYVLLGDTPTWAVIKNGRGVEQVCGFE